jgi:hypothetical protein
MTTEPASKIHAILPARKGRWRALLLGCAVFLVVAGAKLAVVDRFASDLPNWDQWDAEGLALFLPYARGELTFTRLFEPHNEHRVVWSKLLALGLLKGNGQWDSRLEGSVNAALHAALAAAVVVLGVRRLAHHVRAAWVVLVVALMAPPISWHNAISSFHSQQYLLLLFSLPATALLAASAPWTWRWWTGVACAVLALFTQGSGLFAAAAAMGAVVADRNPLEALRARWPTLVAGALVLAGGAALHVSVPYHDALKAHSAREFLLTFWHCLQWPAAGWSWFPLLAWAPWTWLAWRSLRGRAETAERVVFAIGIWALLQFAAMGYARGADAPWPPSRYLDTVAVGVGVNAFALLLTLSRMISRTWSASRERTLFANVGTVAAWVAALGVWGAFLGIGLIQELTVSWNEILPGEGERLSHREDSLRAYLITGDRVHLDGTEIPYPSADALLERIKHPELRAIMPASVRPPLPLAGGAEPSSVFAPGAVDPAAAPPPALAVWGSHATGTGRAATGSWRSEPVPAAAGGYWLFRVAGDLEAEAGAVELRDAADRRLARLSNGTHRRHGWSTVIIPAPRVATTLAARDTSTANWVGFSGPTEMGTWSFVAWQAARWGETIAIAGFALTVLILLMEMPGPRGGWLRPTEPVKGEAGKAEPEEGS